MGNLAVWFLGLVGPLAKKVLLMLGIGTLTYAALTPLINSIISNAQSMFGQIGGTTAQLIGLAGIPQVFGIIAGALVARVSFISLNKLGKVTSS